MNLDELRTVQSKERSKDSLQHLRESFYADVGEYIEELKDQRDLAAERADDPFDDPEVSRLTDEIHTAEDVVEAVYERRVGKVVKRASLAAAGMPADDEGLTAEERSLFSELVERIEANKDEVLDILAGEEANSTATASSASATPDATTSTPDSGDAPAPSEDVSAADVMGGADATPATAADASAGAPTDSSATDAAATDASAGAREGSPTPRPDADEATAVAGDSDGADADSDADEREDPTEGLEERTTIRITRDVGEIFGVDERTYELASEDVVTLPEENAEPLVEQGAAEKLD